MSKNPKIWQKQLKMKKKDPHIFWTAWRISMQFSMKFCDNIKSYKQWVHFLENALSKKSWGVGLAVSVGKKALMCIVVLYVKGTSTDISKTVFRKVLFMLSSMPSFSFIGYILTELFRKPDNWRQIYKQTSSTFSTSNDLSKRKHY